MSTYTWELRAELSFGDVCEADFLYDVHVREDARSMGREVIKADWAKKRFGIEAALPYFLPALDPKQGESFVLAHGVHQPALLLSDDCLTATVLGRDTGKPTNKRLLFAPLVPGSEEDIEGLESGNFGRFPLPGDEHFSHHQVVDLRRCFMADGRAVHAATAAEGFRLRSLADEALENIAVRWSAYSIRRGPFVAEDNGEKLFELLIASGRANEAVALDVATSVAEVVAAAWGYEGRAVEEAGVAADESLPVDPVIERLIADLETLGDATDRALNALRAL